MNTPTNTLLDHLLSLITGKQNDAALSRALEVSPVVISKLRHGKLTIGPSMILKAHEAFGVSISDIKEMAGLPVRGGA